MSQLMRIYTQSVCRLVFKFSICYSWIKQFFFLQTQTFRQISVSFHLKLCSHHEHSLIFCQTLTGFRVLSLPPNSKVHLFCWMIVGQGSIALAVGARGGLLICLDILLSCIPSLLFLPLCGRRPNID